MLLSVERQTDRQHTTHMNQPQITEVCVQTIPYSHQSTQHQTVHNYLERAHVGLKSSASSMGGRESRAGLVEADLLRLGTAASLELVNFLALRGEVEGTVS